VNAPGPAGLQGREKIDGLVREHRDDDQLKDNWAADATRHSSLPVTASKVDGTRADRPYMNGFDSLRHRDAWRA
jgi:hypothetical protein